MNFTKMHGLGNDFIIIENLNGENIEQNKLAKKVCDRHFGIGADGLIVVENSETADIKMNIINSDGSTAEMCGNGVRCFARYVFDKGIIKKNNLKVETLAGIMDIDLKVISGIVDGVRVDMGKPSFEKELIPFCSNDNNKLYKIVVNEVQYNAATLLMGVPHTILFVENLDEKDVISIGKLVENMPVFPQRTNVNFVKIIDRTHIEVRTWERGAGFTLACGTGTCASVVACITNNLTDNTVTASLAGGELEIEYIDGSVIMNGPAEYICTGSII